MTDSNFVANIDAFRFIYQDLATAKIQSALPLMTDLLTINNTIGSLRNNANTPIALLYGSYASLRDDALSQNLFTISSQQVYDVAGRTQNPYLTNIVFAAAPITEKFRDTVRLGFNAALYYSNTAATVSNVSVDFKDGLGYKLIPANGIVTKIYTDSSSTKPIDIKAQLSSGSYVYCHSSIDVTVTLNGASNRYTGTDPYAKEVVVPTVAGEGLGGDVMQIRYSVNNPTRTSAFPHLRKPQIIVEGYDVSGQYNILNLIRNNSTNPQKGEWINLFNITGYDFMNDLDDIAGYDLVFVNYNTLRSFEDNSKMLQHAIEWIKQDKTAGGFNNLNVIIGVSAGGVLARYTLAKMTKTISAVSTDTRLLITHDSPHQGANVPLAFQHFLYDLGEQTILGKKIKDNKEDLKNFYSLNLAPATAQLLKARVVSQGVVQINSFLNGPQSSYQQMVNFSPGDNVPIYSFKATAQGSQCGVGVMPADGLVLANYDDVFSIVNFKWLGIPNPYKTKYFLKTQLNALPSSGVAQIEYFKFSRRFSLWGVGLGSKTLHDEPRYNPAGFVQWDAAPGSTQSIADRTNGALNTGLEKQKLPWYATPFVKVRAGLNMNVTQDLFSFVSTTSALDAPSGTALNSVYIFSSTGTSGTSAQKYIAQEKFNFGSAIYYNANHTDFTARNAKWMYNEMENITQTVSCLDHCGIATINGPLTLCGTSTYTVLNLPPGSTVIWSATPAGLVSFGSPNLTQTTVFQTGSGTATLRVTISNACNSPAVTKTISVGAPSINAYSVFGASTVYASAEYIYSAAYLGNATFVTNPFWRVPADWTIVSGQGTNNIQVMTGNTGGAVQLDFDNNCGERTGVFKTVQIGFGGPAPLIVTDPQSRQSSTAVLSVLATPNPANNKVTIALVSKEIGTKRSAMNVIEQIMITDKTGMQKRQFSFKSRNSSQNISLSGLAPDTYVVQVFNGEQWLSIKLLVL